MRVHRVAPALLAALAAVSLWIAAPTRAEAQFSGTGSYDGLAIGAGIVVAAGLFTLWRQRVRAKAAQRG